MQKYAKNTQKHLILPYNGVLQGVWGYPRVTETLTHTLTRDPDGFPQPMLFPTWAFPSFFISHLFPMMWHYSLFFFCFLGLTIFTLVAAHTIYFYLLRPGHTCSLSKKYATRKEMYSSSTKYWIVLQNIIK